MQKKKLDGSFVQKVFTVFLQQSSQISVCLHQTEDHTAMQLVIFLTLSKTHFSQENHFFQGSGIFQLTYICKTARCCSDIYVPLLQRVRDVSHTPYLCRKYVSHMKFFYYSSLVTQQYQNLFFYFSTLYSLHLKHRHIYQPQQ